MKLKLIIAIVPDTRTEDLQEAARAAGATGITVIHQARGEGRAPAKTFLGMDTQLMCDALMFVVAASRAERVLAAITEAGGLEEEEGAGVAFQLDVEAATGFLTQLPD